jgi:hypothetical protein
MWWRYDSSAAPHFMPASSVITNWPIIHQLSGANTSARLTPSFAAAVKRQFRLLSISAADIVVLDAARPLILGARSTIASTLSSNSQFPSDQTLKPIAESVGNRVEGFWLRVERPAKLSSVGRGGLARWA